MLDVHPPHHPLHAWRDFYIHIATIVIGLLIAVGLEQIVERTHEHFQLRETRDALREEALANDKEWADNEHDWRRVYVELNNNLTVLAYLRKHPATPQTALPGDLRWSQYPFGWNHAVWDAAQQQHVVQLMSLGEANRYQQYYGIMSGLSEQSLSTWNAINDAHRFDLLDPDPTHLSTPQLDEVIQLTLVALRKHVVFGDSFGLFAHEFPDHPHTITWESIDGLKPSVFDLDPKGMASAHERTSARLKAANSGPNGTTIDAQALR